MVLIDSNLNDLASLPPPFYWKLITLIVALVAVSSYEKGIKDRTDQLKHCSDLERKVEIITADFETETSKLNLQISERDTTIDKLNENLKKCTQNLDSINNKLNVRDDIISELKDQGINENEITNLYYSLKYEREVARLNVLYYDEGKIVTCNNRNFLQNYQLNFLYHLYYNDKNIPISQYSDITIGYCSFVSPIKNKKGDLLLQFKIIEQISSQDNMAIFEKLNNNDKTILDNTAIGLCYSSDFDSYDFETIERIFNDLTYLKKQMKRG